MYLESCRTPIHKLNSSFGLNTRNSCINVLRHHVPTKQQTAGHVFSMTRVALHHLVSRFKARSCDLSDTQLFVIGFLGRDNWSVSGQRKVYTGVWHQIGLKSKVKNKSLSLLFIQFTFGVYDISLLKLARSRPCKAGENLFRNFRFSPLLKKQTLSDFNSTREASADGTLSNEFFAVPYKCFMG